MGTKEKILNAALRLFNEQGIDVITIRHIAKEIGISHSNIQYYFKNANEIIATIYSNHLAELNGEVLFEKGEQSTLADMLKSVEIILSHIYQYRFVYIYLIAIVRRIPEIKNYHNERYKLRSEQLLNMFDHLRKKGVFRNDIPASIWKSLIIQIYTIGDFWISANELANSGTGQPVVDAYTSLVSDMLYPYLTAKGRKQAVSL